MKRQDLLESITCVFEIAVKERSQRTNFEEDPVYGLSQPGWALFERKVMWVAVNLWRGALHLPAVSIYEIARCETMAYGNLNYLTQFPIYCAELAAGTVPRYEIEIGDTGHRSE